MDLSLVASNILNPPILAFFMGMLAIFLKSDLEIPAPIPKLFSLYLLFAIGFKGGVELSKSGIDQQLALTIAAAMLMSMLVPIYTFSYGGSNSTPTMPLRSQPPTVPSAPSHLLPQPPSSQHRGSTLTVTW